jgi:hypothetical protein
VPRTSSLPEPFVVIIRDHVRYRRDSVEWIYYATIDQSPKCISVTKFLFKIIQTYANRFFFYLPRKQLKNVAISNEINLIYSFFVPNRSSDIRYMYYYVCIKNTNE